MAEAEYKSLFDISDAEGLTASERLLARLCRRSFLSLWSHANLHTDQDMRDGKGSAKEFADVLVVFGDDVVIFSDKHIKFQENKPIEITWPRWYKRAIADSATQLHGAKSWLTRFPNRVFLDAKCSRPLPITIPTPDRARFHLVAVTRGSFDACAKHFPGSLGTHQIKTDVEGKAHEATPFTVGVLDRGKHFVHVLDEMSLEVVMDEMDTVTDFITYLCDREKFLSDSRTVVAAAGEEQLIAQYISNNHSFLPPLEGEFPDLIWFDESHYPGLKKHPDYLAMRQANEISKAWDELVERFIHLGDPALVAFGFEQPNNETEKALRLMASEPRFRRRVLVNTLKDTFIAASQMPGKRWARVLSSRQHPHLVYIFVIMPRLDDESYEAYRRHRVATLHAYARCSKLRFPEAYTFIALGFDHPIKDYEGSSEDLFVYIIDEWTAEAEAEAVHYRQELGILGEDMRVQDSHFDEFPKRKNAGSYDEKTATSTTAKQRSKQLKRKTKIAKASKRRNR